MSSGEESDLYRQLQPTSDRARYKLSCVTVLLRKHKMRFRPFYSLVVAIQSKTIKNLFPYKWKVNKKCFPLYFIYKYQ